MGLGFGLGLGLGLFEVGGHLGVLGAQRLLEDGEGGHVERHGLVRVR